MTHTIMAANTCSSGCSTYSQCTGLVNATTKYSCQCLPGYLSPNNNGKSCTNNLCKISNGGCNQKCSYAGPLKGNCTCIQGYTLLSDNLTCAAQCNSTYNPCGNFSSCANNTVCVCDTGYVSPGRTGTGCALPPTSSSSASLTGIVAGSVGGGVVLIFAAILIIVHIKKRRSSSRYSPASLHEEPLVKSKVQHTLDA